VSAYLRVCSVSNAESGNNGSHKMGRIIYKKIEDTT
jgi:hypothetical protein